MILLSVLVLSAMTVIALSVSDVVRNGILASRNQVDSTKAFFAAEAGAERILWEIWQNGYDPEDQSCNNNDYFCFGNPPLEYGIEECGPACDPFDSRNVALTNEASYYITYYYEDDGSNSTTTLYSYGNYKDKNTRVVKIIY